MAILSKTVTIKLTGVNVKHFESLGYIIPKYKDSRNRIHTKKNSTLNVNINDLLPNSCVKILVKCDNPNCINGINNNPKENLINYRNIKAQYFCRKCANNQIEHLEKLHKSHLGKHLSEITIKKISKNNWMSKHLGKMNPNYNHNLTDKERKEKRIRNGTSTWKRKVKKRDNFICQKCGYVGHKYDGILHAHHINSYDLFPDLKLNVNNGITLCYKCHESKNIGIHSIYGNYPTKEECCDFMQNSYLENNHQISFKECLSTILIILSE